MSTPAPSTGPLTRAAALPHHDVASHAGKLARLGWRGLLAVSLFAGTVGWWAVATRVDAAVVARARLVPAVEPVPVTHPSGGVVVSVLVREGERVVGGAPLLRFEDSAAQAKLGLLTRQMAEIEVLLARLVAEHRGDERIYFADSLSRAAQADVGLERLMHAETRLFETRSMARRGSVAQLTQRIAQIDSQIAAVRGQLAARRAERAANDAELASIRPLYDRQLVSLTRYAALERSAALLDSQIGQLLTQISQLSGKISETRLEIIQIDHRAGAEALREMREADARQFQLAERLTIARQELAQMTVAAPADGIVHRLVVSGPGRVVRPGETMLFVVPDALPPVVMAEIAPRDIDLVQVGQPVRVSLASSRSQSRPNLSGTLERISATVTGSGTDRAGEGMFAARIALDPESLRTWSGEALRPGMIGEVVIAHHRRSPIGYIFGPILQQIGGRRQAP